MIKLNGEVGIYEAVFIPEAGAAFDISPEMDVAKPADDTGGAVKYYGKDTIPSNGGLSPLEKVSEIIQAPINLLDIWVTMGAGGAGAASEFIPKIIEQGAIGEAIAGGDIDIQEIKDIIGGGEFIEEIEKAEPKIILPELPKLPDIGGILGNLGKYGLIAAAAIAAILIFTRKK